MPKVVKEKDRHVCRTVSVSERNYNKCVNKGKGSFSAGVRWFIEKYEKDQKAKRKG